MKKSKPLNWLS